MKLGLTDPYELVRGIGSLEAYQTVALPAPSATVSWQDKVQEWPVALNNALGDCTIAGWVHALEVQAAEVGETCAYPGDPAVEKTYYGLTGGPDSGLLLSTVIGAASTRGLFGHRLNGAAMIHPHNVTALKQTIDFWGCAYVGVTLPQSAEQQFADQQPWTVDQFSSIAGGHCILHVGYDADYIYSVTWGSVVRIAWSWWRAYGTQAFALVPDYFTAANHGPTASLNLAAMKSDLAVLAREA